MIFRKDPQPRETKEQDENGPKMSFLEAFKLSRLTRKNEERNEGGTVEGEESPREAAPRRPSQVEMFLYARIATFMVNMDAIADTEARMSTFKHNIETLGDMITGRDRAECPTAEDEAKGDEPESKREEEEKKEEED